MKKRGFVFALIIILLMSPIFAETTFFEGDYGSGDDFIMANLPSEVVTAISEGASIGQTSTGGFFVRQSYNSSEVCVLCYQDLRDHIQETRKINYTEADITVLATEIKTDLEIDLSNNQVRYIVENFEDECNMTLPLLGGFAGGRSTDLISPFILAIAILLLIGVIVIGILIIRVLKKKKNFKRTKKRKK